MSANDLALCTLETCPIEEYGLLHYLPSLPGNALYLAIFAVLLVPQLFLGFRHRTWGYLIGLTGGIILEVLGYAARILLRGNIYTLNWFVMQICCLTVGPAWFSAAVYVCLSRIIYIYGTDLSPVRPQLITLVFIACDVIAMSLQAVGGALTSAAAGENQLLSDQGVYIMIAGLTFQVATTLSFCIICVLLFWKIKKNPSKINQDTVAFRKRPSFRLFLTTISIASLAILIRCCYRLVELSQGYDSELANDQVAFMILEGAMMIICVIALTIGHPGPILGEFWSVGKFRFSALRGKRDRHQEAPFAVERPDMVKHVSETSASSTEQEQKVMVSEHSPAYKTHMHTEV